MSGHGDFLKTVEPSWLEIPGAPEHRVLGFRGFRGFRVLGFSLTVWGLGAQSLGLIAETAGAS